MRATTILNGKMSGTPFLKAQDHYECVMLRNLSTLLTTVLAAKLVWPHVPKLEGQTLKIAFLGAREYIEGVVNMAMLRSMLQTICGWQGSRLQVDLIGPEMTCSTLPTPTPPGVDVRCIQGLYHETKRQPVHIAVVSNGGIDNYFASWVPTILCLRDQRTPTVFTGYRLDKIGCERMLRSLRANIVAPTATNPFRIVGPSSLGYPDEFLVAMCGVVANVPSTPLDLKELHRQERMAKLEELAQVNHDEGQVFTAKRLRQLRSKLVAKEIVIPEDVPHNVLEGWAMGQHGPAW